MPKPPFVIHVDGEITEDGEAIGLRIVRSEQGSIDLCLRTADVQSMVSVLLALGCEANRRRPADVDGPPRSAIPLPISAINVGQNEDSQVFLMLEVGGTDLMFHLPPNFVKEIGETLPLQPCESPAQALHRRRRDTEGSQRAGGQAQPDRGIERPRTRHRARGQADAPACCACGVLATKNGGWSPKGFCQTFVGLMLTTQ